MFQSYQSELPPLPLSKDDDDPKSLELLDELLSLLPQLDEPPQLLLESSDLLDDGPLELGVLGLAGSGAGVSLHETPCRPSYSGL